MLKCNKCNKEGPNNTRTATQENGMVNEWLCIPCYERYLIDLNTFNKMYCQPECSKREGDLMYLKCACGEYKHVFLDIVHRMLCCDSNIQKTEVKVTHIEVGDLGYMKYGDEEIKIAVVRDQMQEGVLNLMRRSGGTSNDLVWTRLGMGTKEWPDPEITKIVGKAKDWYECYRWLFQDYL